MTVKTNQNALRNEILKSGNVRQTQDTKPSELKHVNRAESMAAAIAARRQDIGIATKVTRSSK